MLVFRIGLFGDSEPLVVANLSLALIGGSLLALFLCDDIQFIIFLAFILTAHINFV